MPSTIVYNLAVETTSLADAAVNYGIEGLPRREGLYGRAVISAVVPTMYNWPNKRVSEQVGEFVALSTRSRGRHTSTVLLNRLHVMNEESAVGETQSTGQWLYENHPTAKKEIGTYMLKTLLRWDAFGTLREDDAADEATVKTLYTLLGLRPYATASNAQRKHMDYSSDFKKKVMVLPRDIVEQRIMSKYTDFAPAPVLTGRQVSTSHLRLATQKRLQRARIDYQFLIPSILPHQNA